MIRILFLGSHVQSYRSLHSLVNDISGVEVVGVVPSVFDQERRDDQRVERLASDNGIALLTLDEASDIDFDLGIALLFDKIISKDIVNRPRMGFVNFHLGPLPRLRGANSVYHALRLAREEMVWEFGVTAHYMEETLDSGPIIDYINFPIFPDDTAFSLHTRACDAISTLFKRLMPELLKSNMRLPATEQQGSISYFKRGSVLHDLTDYLDQPDTFLQLVRAATFPKKPKPFVMINGVRVYVSLTE